MYPCQSTNQPVSSKLNYKSGILYPLHHSTTIPKILENQFRLYANNKNG